MTLFGVLVSILSRSAELGTLDELLATLGKLSTLLQSVLSDPKVVADLNGLTLSAGGGAAIRPAQPEDPAMAREGQHTPGGR